MYVERHTLAITTAADGTATAYTPAVTGRVLAVVYTKSTFADGVDFTITVEGTAEPVLALTNQNASGVFYPRQQAHGSTGTGLTYDGTRTVCEPVAVANDRVKVAVAQGGNALAGTVDVVIG